MSHSRMLVPCRRSRQDPAGFTEGKRKYNCLERLLAMIFSFRLKHSNVFFSNISLNCPICFERWHVIQLCLCLGFKLLIVWSVYIKGSSAVLSICRSYHLFWATHRLSSNFIYIFSFYIFFLFFFILHFWCPKDVLRLKTSWGQQIRFLAKIEW